MRLDFEMSDRSYEESEELRKTLGYPTLAAMVGRALDLLRVVIQVKLDGGEVLVKDKHGTITTLDFPGNAKQLRRD